MLCMMGTYDLIKFMFACADSDGSSIIGKEEFEMMNEVMSAGTPKGSLVEHAQHHSNSYANMCMQLCVSLYPSTPIPKVS